MNASSRSRTVLAKLLIARSAAASAATTTTGTATVTDAVTASGKALSRPAFAASTTAQQRAFVSATNALLEKHITKVPTMGDSITEGTIVEWVAQVGQKVEEEDVVALIETDKVTVDIKAAKAGVIVQQFGAVDDEVEVGADLYEIDTEAIATVEATSAAAATTTTEPTPPVVAEAPAASTAASASVTPPTRVPSIHFLGKEGWRRALTVEPEVVIPSSYGRLAFSEEEMEALWSGGANLAPELKEFSTGAVFAA
mmetsp:Transcript_18522/g.51695  ORF Transcript_18522/g.51695 Transcript_18522/m.51695 type:complete len:255 (-) Transcript_18522:404-1168(-)